MNLLVRTTVDPHSIVSAVRAQAAAVDPDQPVTSIQTVEELMDNSRAQPRFAMFLVGAFSATALVLAVIGLYGMLAYSIAQRRQELGIRLALGAERSDILRLVVGQGMALTSAGILLGLALALVLSLALTRVLKMLFKVSVHDLVAFAIAPFALLTIAFFASYLPAYRAAQTDPTEALRHG